MIDLSRRELCLTAPTLMTATFLGASLIGMTPASAASGALTRSFGGNGGDAFGFEYPQNIGLSFDQEVDALFLNDRMHGGDGGGSRRDAALAGDDYWNWVSVRSGGRVDYLEFRSQNGQSIGGGGSGGNATGLTGIRLLGIAGRSGARLDQITLKFIANYRPSTLVEANVPAILDLKAGPATIKTYTDQTAQVAQAYERVVEHMSEFSMSASAEAELFSKFSVSTGLKLQDTSKETVRQSSEQVLKSGQSIEKPIPDSQVGFLIARMNVMQDDGGQFWMLPRTGSSWVYLKDSDFGRLRGFYDLTGAAATQTNLPSREYRGFNYLPV